MNFIIGNKFFFHSYKKEKASVKTEAFLVAGTGLEPVTFGL